MTLVSTLETAEAAKLNVELVCESLRLAEGTLASVFENDR